MLTLDEDWHHGLSHGAFAFVTKPTTTEGLAAAITRIREYAVPRRKQLLVVEDDAFQRLSIEALLGHDDIEVELLSNGQEAIAAVERQVFDCMVLDLRLPDMTGFELLDQLNKLPNGKELYRSSSLPEKTSHQKRTRRCICLPAVSSSGC